MFAPECACSLWPGPIRLPFDQAKQPSIRNERSACHLLSNATTTDEEVVYAELDLKFRKSIVPSQASATIKEIIGVNEIEVTAALAGSPLASVASIVQSALAAEQVMAAATVIYFMEGNDTIKVHIAVRSLAEVRKQCSRITRQLSNKIGTLSAANATVLVQVKGTDEAVLIGEKVSFVRHLWTTIGEKFAGKFLPAAATFALATMFLPGTTVVSSAAIGAVAAGVGALVEAAIAARNSGDWKWRDLS